MSLLLAHSSAMVDHFVIFFSQKDQIATKLINVPAEIRKYWWEKSEDLINVPGTTISDSRVFCSMNEEKIREEIIF